ncbi:hypothetical protein OGAPHI_005784 [Ogataea philodendri]|uniref:Uncharacterized protein n=1 Tax=Ogataea philodendri TaxID=1378263 RepID=A0A9P8P0D6_9ASCO|nr:uncharacterized protein OGAPHI_005784 [Ogataea philodendri]KAH3662532.1 hypothetical protein OGAPHI_005784 [Ogataea philodendri]
MCPLAVPSARYLAQEPMHTGKPYLSICCGDSSSLAVIFLRVTNWIGSVFPGSLTLSAEETQSEDSSQANLWPCRPATRDSSRKSRLNAIDLSKSNYK